MTTKLGIDFRGIIRDFKNIKNSKKTFCKFSRSFKIEKISWKNVKSCEKL